jgi:hypothetical protein
LAPEFIFRRSDASEEKTMRPFHSICQIFTVFLISFLIGCGTTGPTKPNLPFSGNPYPVVLNDLFQKNPLLAKELGKLPEFQDGISDTEKQALEQLTIIYNENQEAFNHILEQMYHVGLPEVRKYCSPLQAVYWLIEDGKTDNINIHNYDLINLLNNAWWSTLFEYNDTKGRWENFSDVTERLNSPILLDYYERRDFGYVRFEKVGYKLEYGGPPPNVIFEKKKGSCSYYTSFSAYCLHIAGYQGKAITVKYNHRTGDFHRVCEFVDKDGKFYIMDNSRKITAAGSGIFPKESFLNEYIFVSYGYHRWKRF